MIAVLDDIVSKYRHVIQAVGVGGTKRITGTASYQASFQGTFRRTAFLIGKQNRVREKEIDQLAPTFGRTRLCLRSSISFIGSS